MGAGAGPGEAAGRLLRRYRIDAGLTQEELAQRSGLSVRALTDIQRGHTARPHPRTLRLIADALGLGEPDRRQLLAAFRHIAEDADVPGLPGLGQRTAQQLVVPRQLPLALRYFAGRAAELQALDRLMDVPERPRGAVVISAIGGTAGVGKTALAVHWAHQAADQFPDGQLYVNLRGFDRSGAPMSPPEAIRKLVDAFEVPAAKIPADVDAQAGLYRSLLAGKRVLVILDNARDEQQVRLLLPASPGCLVLVTSRALLTGLVAAEQAHPLTVGLLTEDEAGELLARRLGPARTDPEPHAVSELIGLCARLPLALAIVAARAATQPALPLASLAAGLRSSASRLEMLDTGEPSTNVRAVFSWSYAQLSLGAARMFRLLGVHPGPDISMPAAASLAAVPCSSARVLLDELAGAHLVTQPVPGRFAFHDLLRCFAAEQATALDSQAERHAAKRRTLDHYLRTARLADQMLYPARDTVALAAPQRDVTPEEIDSHSAAMAWFDAERKVLLAAAAQAAAYQFDNYAWQIPWAMATFFARRGYWEEWVGVQEKALLAAERSGDAVGQAQMHRYLGRAHIRLGRHDEAYRNLLWVLELYRRLGDAAGQALTHIDIAQACESRGDYRVAIGHARQALRLYETEDHRTGIARALNTLGWDHAHLGRHKSAVTCCEQALSLHHVLGDSFGEATALDSLGYAHRHLGQHGQAADRYQRAIELYAELGDRYHQADTLRCLGDTLQAAGRAPEARRRWEQALEILDDLDHPDATEIREKLGELTPHHPD